MKPFDYFLLFLSLVATWRLWVTVSDPHVQELIDMWPKLAHQVFVRYTLPTIVLWGFIVYRIWG